MGQIAGCAEDNDGAWLRHSRVLKPSRNGFGCSAISVMSSEVETSQPLFQEMVKNFSSSVSMKEMRKIDCSYRATSGHEEPIPNPSLTAAGDLRRRRAFQF
jgi:hypothetical protein